MAKFGAQRIRREFVSEENRRYRFKIGKHHASALSGLIAGAILATIIWFSVAFFMNLFN